MIMRGGRLQRSVLLPFSIRCDSESSVALAVSTSATAVGSPKPSNTRNLKMHKNQSLPRASFTNRLIKRFKSFSQFFIYKEEIEREMEIGYPTDVKHLTHIGLDGSTTSNPVSNWGNHLKAAEIHSFPSISLHQFELAMAAQSHA